MPPMESQSLAEALMTKILFLLQGKESELNEIEILDTDMRSSGGWRLIIWLRAVEGSKLAERFGKQISTIIVHEQSFVEVYPDAKVPLPPE